MSAPTSSFEMDVLDAQNAPVLDDTLLLKDTQDSNLLKETILRAITIPYTWGSSDEDSPLAIGLQYTTEASEIFRNLGEVILSLKNAPTGSIITVDILKETGPNTNAFTTIFSTLPTIDINEFISQTATIPAVFSVTTWETQRRLQIVLTINDSNFAATGLKVSLR